MGRVKLKIQKLENASGRQVTYSKRRAGILKKARELGILCDIDVLLLMFSPTGRPTLCIVDQRNPLFEPHWVFSNPGDFDRVAKQVARLFKDPTSKNTYINATQQLLFKGLQIVCRVMRAKNARHGSGFLEVSINFKDVIARFSRLTPQERTKRKSESLEALKKTFKKLDHDVKVEDFLGLSIETVEELTNYSRLLQTELLEIQKRLSYWVDPDKVNNIDHISALEVSLKESLSRIHEHKENFGKHQLMSLECSSQNGMPLPLGVGDEQQPSPLRWLRDSNIQHMMVSESNLLPPRDIGCSSDTTLQSYAGYFNTAKQTETNNQGQEDTFQDFSQNTCLRLQLGGHYPYQSYDMNLLTEKKFQPDGEISVQEDVVDYQVNHFEPPGPGYDSSIQNWATTSESCSITTFDEHSYPQQAN